VDAHLRIARPVRNLEQAVAMYERGLGLERVAGFVDHTGFDGAMLGRPGMDYHLEFTTNRIHAVRPTPTPEDLLVFYLPDESAWRARCQAVLDAGFVEVESFNPYWSERGRTFEDRDGYRVVLQCATWTNG
jgi:catechol 2,3-dioxygenase-like lactoylglutathione lyase family enzyme